LSFINLNFINFTLFTLGILLTPNIHTFTAYVSKSIGAASGILIQFPLYAGIMGIMKYSGLFLVFTDFFVHISNSTTLPLFTLLSAGIVNFFVPSGGGQWAVQGPVIVEAARQLGTPVSKIIMALAYGDEWTNMLQPFWALPLLGITGLKARQIVPYTFVLFLVGGMVFTLMLLLV
jgi:short-chain fatty acids transporter